jgi:hypothetical protein
MYSSAHGEGRQLRGEMGSVSTIGRTRTRPWHRRQAANISCSLRFTRLCQGRCGDVALKLGHTPRLLTLTAPRGHSAIAGGCAPTSVARHTEGSVAQLAALRRPVEGVTGAAQVVAQQPVLGRPLLHGDAYTACVIILLVDVKIVRSPPSGQVT